MDSSLKNEIGMMLSKVLENYGETQEKISNVLGVDQGKVSLLMSSKFRSFSLERILIMFNKLGYNVNIKINKSVTKTGCTKCLFKLKNRVQKND